jgi:hypothetical protein
MERRDFLKTLMVAAGGAGLGLSLEGAAESTDDAASYILARCQSRAHSCYTGNVFLQFEALDGKMSGGVTINLDRTGVALEDLPNVGEVFKIHRAPVGLGGYMRRRA